MTPQDSTAGRRPALAIGLALATLMFLTRIGHFSELSRLPDASWAVFLLGGWLLRDVRLFGAFFAFAWLIDVAAVLLGTPADCFSPAYLFLVPAYGSLWAAGRFASARVRGSTSLVAAAPMVAAVMVAAVVAAFVISNLGVFLLADLPAGVGVAEYAGRVQHYLPGYLLVTLAYATMAALAHRAVVRLGAGAGSGRTR